MAIWLDYGQSIVNYVINDRMPSYLELDLWKRTTVNKIHEMIV